VAEAVGHASEKLSQFTGLKQNATQLVKTAQEIRDQLDDIEREIRSALKDILADMDSSDEAHGS
jgi:BMFP domain-containing protein YqiC